MRFNTRLDAIEKRLPRTDGSGLVINIVYVDGDENGSKGHASPPDWADQMMLPYARAEHERKGGPTVVIEWTEEHGTWYASIGKSGSWRVTPDGCEPLEEPPYGHISPRYAPTWGVGRDR